MAQNKDTTKGTSASSKAKRQFFLLWLAFFVVAFVAVNAAGLSPSGVNELGADAVALAQGSVSSSDNSSVSASSADVSQTGEAPIGISIPKAGLNAAVINATDTSSATMDADLLKGAVHYPGSSNLGVNGTVYILGHSDGLPIKNSNYKVFNSLKTLVAGDIIVVNSSDRAYTYAVDSVTLIDSNQAMVSFTTDSQKLVLSTCNVWGAVEQRYVVVAHLVSSQSITTF